MMPWPQLACAANQRASIRTAGWSSFLAADAPPGLAEPPDAARALFGPRLPLVEAYAERLATAGVERGLIGPAEPGRLWERHLLNSGVVAGLITADTDTDAGQVGGGKAEPGTVELADIGSGAGLPGLVLAIMLPRLRVVLVEPMARRTAFLLECAVGLGLDNVEVRRARAEELAGEIQADVVTSRAVAPLDRLAPLAIGLARPGGLVLAVKGASAEQELSRAEPVLRELGVRDARVVTAGSGLLAQPTWVVCCHAPAGADQGLGRRRGQGSGRRRSGRRAP